MDRLQLPSGIAFDNFVLLEESAIAIELEGSEDRLSLRVTDDGAGFHPKPGGQSGIGLKIMDYRARTVGGKLSIGGNAPRGTVVSCTIDHPAKAAQIPEAIVYE